MTKEEQAQYIAEKVMENPEFRKAFVGAITDAANVVVKAIKALEDEYIKVPKGALKYRTAGMVAYNAEWLKNHFDIERAAIFGVQEPKMGHWISLGTQGEIDGQIVRAFTCSECGAISIFRMASGNVVNGDLCPNCRSTMQEVNDES